MKTYNARKFGHLFNPINYKSEFSENIFEHIIQTIKNTEIKKEKFKYLFIKNFFPENDYLILLNFLKKIKVFSLKYAELLHDDGTNTYNISNSYLLKFKDDFNDEEKKLSIIDEFNECFSDFMINISSILHFTQNILLNIFFDEIKERDSYLLKYGFLNKKYLKYQTDLFFNIFERRRTDFFISPHLHTATELVDCLFYTPEDETNSFNGTSLYRPNTKVKLHASGFSKYQDLETDDFENYYSFKYIPNSVVCWPNVPYSIHGSEYSNSVNNSVEKSYIFFGSKRVFPDQKNSYIFQDNNIFL